MAKTSSPEETKVQPGGQKDRDFVFTRFTP